MARHMRPSRQDARGRGGRRPRRSLVPLAVAAIAVVAVVVALQVRGCGGGGAAPASEGGAVASTATSASDSQAIPDSSPASSLDQSSLAGMIQAGEVSSIRLVGDSITAGYGCDGYDQAATTQVVAYSGSLGTYYETPESVRCWANDFREWATAHGVGTFVNAGVSGFRMKYLAEEPDAWLGDGADVIVVMLGTNDAAKEPVSSFREYATQALAAAASKCRHLVVVSPPNNQRTDATNLYGMDQVDGALTQICEEQGYEHVSLYDVLQVGTSDFNADQCHPTTSGSDKLWAALEERLNLTKVAAS
jgi:lysophospholipase L1-like esterase